MRLVQRIREKANEGYIDSWGQINAQNIAERQIDEARAMVYSGHRYTNISIERYAELLANSTIEHLGSLGLSGRFTYNPDATLAASADIEDSFPHDAVMLVLDRVSGPESPIISSS